MKRSRNEGTKLASVTATQQSAAEFFSEHQQIAGFDNPGKSLYTTVREFVENSLDAAESIQVLPDVQVTRVVCNDLFVCIILIKITSGEDKGVHRRGTQLETWY